MTQVQATGAQLIQQVRVLDAITQSDRVADVLVQDGVVTEIAPSITVIPASAKMLTGQGKILLPGLVDLYSHSGEPGNESRETLESLLAAGQAGGFTRLGILPNTEPAIDHSAMVEKLLVRRDSIARENPSLPHLYPWGALTQGAQGQQMVELAELAEAAIAGFADGRAIQNPLLVQRLLQYLKPLGKPVALYSCDRNLRDSGVAREGPFSLIYGLVGDPASSETAALAALLECVAEVSTPVHLMRLSTARGVELVQQAKERGLPVTASTTWMHLLFSAKDLGGYDPSLRLSPPLGNPEDQAALIEGVKAGVVDAIAIDHTPHTYEDKTVGFPSAPPGAIGLELALGILWDTFVVNGDWSPLTLLQALSTNPAACWGQTPPTIQPQQPAEIILFDPAATWTASLATLRSLSANTPWLGKEISGRVVRTWVPPLESPITYSPTH
ncbi:dihydroorotase [Nodosilinea sp. LEGE 07298]|uniref:dihydroorotase n=1 Tax=Nodosilinea sp. LEGE 07298 TaxID=2777970 RepID=UPI00187DF69B|nr:dihydroorotase [Nodosilinea sp. LEGE 07298]MBE9109586.1 dihydroorotase [Nodosilinea sp. LEGE 07298]